MNEIKRKIENLVMYYSYKSRKERGYKKFESEVEELNKLSDLSLEAEYINTKAEYEFKKMKLTLFGVTIAIGIMTNILTKLYYFFEKVTHLIYTDTSNGELGKVLLYIFTVFAFIIILIVYLSLSSYIKNLQFLYRHLLIVVKVKKSRNNLEREV